MFKDIVEFVKCSVQAFTVVRNKIEISGRYRHGWRALYDLYTNIDDITKTAITNIEEFSLSDVHAEEEINERLELLSKSVRGFMRSFQHANNAIGVYDEELRRRLEICLWMKSWWYDEFVHIYTAGRVDKEAKKLRKRFLKMSFDLKKWVQKYPSLRRFHDIDPIPEFQEEVRIWEEHDISTPENLEELLDAGRKNVAELVKLKDKLRQYLVENCTLRDLLDA